LALVAAAGRNVIFCAAVRATFEAKTVIALLALAVVIF